MAVVATAAVSMMFTTGCSDYLDKTPTNAFSSSNVWSSAVLARAAATGVYNELYYRFSANYAAPSIGMPGDSWSSVMDTDMNWKNNNFTISGSCTPSNGNVANWYKYFYTIVYRANDVINNIDQVPDMDDA